MSSEKQGVLVVGGAGYIGSHVVKALRDAGKSPVVFDNMSSGLQENLLPGIPFILGDILEPEQLKSAMEGVDSIIHLAALKAAGESMMEPEKYAENNLCGTVNLLSAAAAWRMLVFALKMQRRRSIFLKQRISILLTRHPVRVHVEQQYFSCIQNLTMTLLLECSMK